MKAMREIQVESFELDQVQTNAITAVNDINSKVIIDGTLLSNVVIAAASTPISHKLQRLPLGYIIVSKNGPGDIYQAAPSTTLNLNLQSTIAVTANIWVF